MQVLTQREATDRREDRVDCALVIITFNSGRHVGALLESIPAAAQGLRVRTFVVDNGSSDDTVALVHRWGGDVTCIETGANLGYAGAINVGRPHLGPCSSILVLNADLVLEPGSVTALFSALAEPGVGVAVPRLFETTGDLSWSLRREPTLWRALGDALFGDHFARRPGWASEIVRSSDPYRRPHPVDWATGAVLLIDAECDAAVGPWDEGRFFLYSEETDFARRARRAGWTVMYVPSARARHHQGGSGHGSSLSALMAVNRIRYYEKHHGAVAASLFRAIVVLHELLRAGEVRHRRSLGMVLRRSRWSTLPGGRLPAPLRDAADG